MYAEAVVDTSVQNLSAVFRSVHDAIVQNGKPLKLISGPENTSISTIHEIDCMVAIVHDDGRQELGVTSKGQVTSGFFPVMDKDGNLGTCGARWAENLQVFQARLKL